VIDKNVLWIMTDQFNANCLGAFGSQVRTPNLDRLVREGVAYTRAYANNPICMPSRVSFITGQYCHTHQIFSNDLFEWQNENHDTMAAVFRRSGWQTALIGKAHMVHDWDTEGFEHIRYCDNADNNRSDPRTNHYFNYLVEQGLADGYDYGGIASGPGSDLRGFESAIPYEHSLETWTGNEALGFLRDRDLNRPFFMHFSFERPHEPLSVPFDKGLLYDPAEIELPDSARDYFENKLAGRHRVAEEYAAEGTKGYPYRGENEDELKHQVAYYYSLITLIDEQIGRVFQYLDDTGQWDDTIVVFTADHGDFAGEHGLHLKNIGIWESIQRIPLVIRWPGGPKDTRCDEIVESVDLYPTLANLCGVDAPDTVEGIDLAPVGEGSAPGKEEAICEWGEPGGGGRYPERVNALRTKRYRLVIYDEGNGAELFDHETDPDEMTNVYDHPQYAEVKVELLERLLRRVAQYASRPEGKERRRLAIRNNHGMSRLIFKKNRKWSEIAEYFE
jgi:arylsulfatase A-like enzyme